MSENSIQDVKLIPVGMGYAKTCVNCVMARKDPISTYGDLQYISYYKYKNQVVLARRKLGSKDWEFNYTEYKGKTRDAHNSISIMHDANGILHMSWDHHNDPLRYTQTIKPETLDLTERMKMTGVREELVCYPEFYKDSKGNLYFFYRIGGSGHGDLNLKRFNAEARRWEDVQNDFIDGEGDRNAYWQIYLDENDVIHVSWCWRETNDASTNHDICYARSEDGGKTWLKSTGEPYHLPINQSNAEVVCAIPQDSDLINTTSMIATKQGLIYIATYYRPEGEMVPQTMLVYFNGKKWEKMKVGNRTFSFRLMGTGTLTTPMGPPLILVDDKDRIFVIIREEERGNRITAACCEDITNPKWVYKDLTDFSVETYEPCMDTNLWKERKVLNLLVQVTGDHKNKRYRKWKETMVYVLEWDPRTVFERNA